MNLNSVTFDVTSPRQCVDQHHDHALLVEGSVTVPGCTACTAEEQQWNVDHGFTAECPQCGGAMKSDRVLCSWRCWSTNRRIQRESS